MYRNLFCRVLQQSVCADLPDRHAYERVEHEQLHARDRDERRPVHAAQLVCRGRGRPLDPLAQGPLGDVALQLPDADPVVGQGPRHESQSGADAQQHSAASNRLG